MNQRYIRFKVILHLLFWTTLEQLFLQEIDVLKLQVEQVFLACMGDAINEELKKPALHELVHTEFIGKTRTVRGICYGFYTITPLWF